MSYSEIITTRAFGLPVTGFEGHGDRVRKLKVDGGEPVFQHEYMEMRVGYRMSILMTYLGRCLLSAD